MADVYAKLSGGNLDRQAGFPPVKDLKIYLKTITPLFKQELTYAFEALFAWENLKLEPEDNKQLKVVTSAQ